MSESLLDYIKVYRGCFSSQDCIEIINFVDDDEWQNSLISDDLKAVSYTHLTLPTKRIV